MCGIAGILRVHAPGSAVAAPEVAIPEAWLDALDASVRHRGPDGQGRFRQRAVRADGAIVDVALVHRRLSVIDHAGGGQPMIVGGQQLRAGSSDRSAAIRFGPCAPDVATPAGLADYRPAHGHDCPACAARADGAVAVVFNGCIYNQRQLRRELEAAGHAFASDHADTEVLLHGWRQWGEDLFARLEGMLALAIWDAGGADLIIARDRIGEKPLYFTTGASGVVAFSSLPPGLIAMQGRFELDELALLEWLARGSDLLTTPLASVVQLAPAHWRSLGRELGNRYWAPPGPKALHMRRADASTVMRLLRQSVEARLDADVPVACLLSGGIDSSAVALMARSVRDDVRTLCVRMPAAAYDESDHAGAVAAAIGTEHRTIDAGADVAGDLRHLIESMGLPFGDSSLLPTYWACSAASEDATVLLSGDGGDELFTGYDRYTAAHVLDLHWFLAALAPAGCLGLLSRRNPKSISEKLIRLGECATGRGYLDLLDIFPRRDLGKLTGVWRRRARSSRELMAGADLARRYDLAHHLPADMLRKTDHAAMSSAIELRAPMLDSQLVEQAFSWPAEVALLNRERKRALRVMLKGAIPARLIDRPKQGFAIPVGEWFRTDYGQMRQLLRDHMEGPEPFGPDSLGINDLISRDRVRRLLREHDDAGAASVWPWKGRDHGQRLYMLLALSIWARWLGDVRPVASA